MCDVIGFHGEDEMEAIAIRLEAIAFRNKENMEDRTI